ncbi:MAG: ABC transporter ATP-binding protein [Candidatus Nomurabacteria bacterium]|jgi:putative ABC transport system ATP-binding protein|nr:ABC transporter ATP-binding protein [Candidatus Nomurabacteria bacterium]
MKKSDQKIVKPLNENVLKVKNLRHIYSDAAGQSEILCGLNAEFHGGQLYAIVGESGSGKTTFLSLISALDKVQSGAIEFNGRSIADIGLSRFRRDYVSIVFQSYNLIKYMTARENVEVALDFSGKKSRPNRRTDEKSEAENADNSRENLKEKDRAYELLKQVGLGKGKADRLVQQLSGGEQQRVAIARCMASRAPIITADEPTGNLDAKTEAKILTLFKNLADAGKIVIIVTHSQKVAHADGAKILKMADGRLMK